MAAVVLICHFREMLIDIETVGFLADLAKKKFDATFLFMVFDGKFL